MIEEALEQTNYDDPDEVVQLLEIASEYEGTELGEYWIRLAELWEYRFNMPDHLIVKFEEEVLSCGRSLRDEYVLVKQIETIKRPSFRLDYKE